MRAVENVWYSVLHVQVKTTVALAGVVEVVVVIAVAVVVAVVVVGVVPTAAHHTPSVLAVCAEERISVLLFFMHKTKVRCSFIAVAA